MASDDRRPPGTPGAPPPDALLVDEGRIHEWLDGQCDANTAAQFEALVHTSPAFAARVAEARGLTAAASRILAALDDVPAQVLPPVAASHAPGTASGTPTGATAGASPTPIGAARRRIDTPPRGPSRRFTQWSAIAAVLAVAATGVWVLQSPGSGSTELAGPTVSFDAPPSVALTAPIDAPRTDADRPDVARTEALVAEALVAEAPIAEAPVAGAPGRAVARADVSTDSTSASAAAVAAVAAAPTQAPVPMQAPVPTRAAKAADATAEERAVASAESRTARLPAATAARALAAGASAAAQPRTAAAAAAEAPAEADAVAALIPDPELAYAVHRVACAPTCHQVVTEVGRNGLVRRGDGTSARVDSVALGRLARLVDSLDLAALPTTLRLEGRLCRSVGTLRESLRVRFRVNGALRQVMGLPWCTDGTHPMDVFAQAVEALGRP